MSDSIQKTRVVLDRIDGNIFAVMGVCSRALKADGRGDSASEMCNRVQSEAKDYDNALQIIMEYIEFE